MGCLFLLCLTCLAIFSGTGLTVRAPIVSTPDSCPENSAAYDAFTSTENFTVDLIPGIGYGFFFVNPSLTPVLGGPDVTRGLIIIPANGVSPVAYAPFARGVALHGYYAAIVQQATPGTVLEVMMQHSELEFWTIAGHGTAGELATRIAIAVQPRVKSLVLIAAPLPSKVDLRSINLFVVVIYGSNDTVNIPSDIEQSFSRLRGDTLVAKVSGLGHYDFAYSTCVGNIPSPAADTDSAALTPPGADSILSNILLAIQLQQWFRATRTGLSFGDNHFLTPGFNDSKPYPGDIRVRFDQIEVPETSPQRLWWVFTPSSIKGGIVYFAGTAIEGKAYFPLAFHIAARGHLVVIPEASARITTNSLADATSIIDSDLPILSGVPPGSWAVAGHSLGGLAASFYVGYHGDKVYGAVMHSGGWFYNATMSEVPVLQLYGSVDNANGGAETYEIRYTGLYNSDVTTFVAVEGANHYQVGDYGDQSPNDQIATLGSDAQHKLYAELTVEFLDSLEKKNYSPILFGQTCT